MTATEAIDRLRKRSQIPLFAVSEWDPQLGQALRGTPAELLFEGREVADPKMAGTVIAGLHLWNDSFDAAHNLCQGIATPTGSYWHGLCHRREGHSGEGLAHNLSNCKYWFRQTGEHPAFDAVYRAALQVLDSSGTGFRWATEASEMLRERRRWDPAAMADWFGQADAGTLSGQSARLLEEIQWREIDLLVDWCLVKALGE